MRRHQQTSVLQLFDTVSGCNTSRGPAALCRWVFCAGSSSRRGDCGGGGSGSGSSKRTATTRRHAPRKREVQYICHQRLRADGSKDTQTSSDEESEAEVGEEEEESDDEFCDRTTAPVPKWEVLAGNRAVWVQLCQQLRLGQGSLG